MEIVDIKVKTSYVFTISYDYFDFSVKVMLFDCLLLSNTLDGRKLGAWYWEKYVQWSLKLLLVTMC